MPTLPTFQELSRDVNWQFESFLEQCETFIDNPAPGKKLSPNEAIVQDVLDAYQALARRFYETYEASVLENYDRLSPEAVPQLMQIALDKLVAEWNRVYSVIAAIQTSESSAAKRVTTPLTPVIQAAMRAVGLSPKTFPLVLQFGQSYNMGFFNYIDNFRSLSLPLSALKSPWEWTIFWHELAGERVRLLESAWREFEDIMRRAVRYDDPPTEALGALLDRQFKRIEYDTLEQRAKLKAEMSEKVAADWANSCRQSSPETHDFFQEVSQPLIMFSFDELLVDILSDFLLTDQKAARRQGWSGDWLRELFEDSFSVINFPIDFLRIFDRLQRRHQDGGKKKRHPSRAVRLTVAVFLKMQIAEPESDNPPEDERISTFLEDNHLPTDTFSPDLLEDKLDVKMAWAVARHLLVLHQRMGLPDHSKTKLMKTLSIAMRDYLQEKSPDKIYKQTRSALKGVPQVRLNRLSPRVKNDPRPLIGQLFDDDRLPKPKSPKYERLAQLEFGYTDFEGIASNDAAVISYCPNCATVLELGTCPKCKWNAASPSNVVHSQ